jgi:hypothetical protein
VERQETDNQAASDELNQTFKGILDVVKFLDAAGYKISKSTVYRHRSEGRIRPAADGSFTLAMVNKYASDFLQKKYGGGSGNVKHLEFVVNDKQTAEARKVAAQAEHWEIKTKILRGEYIERASFDRALARRAAVFKSDIENFIRTHCGEMINIVKGNSIYLPDLTEFWLEQAEKWLGRYAEPDEFEIPAQADLEESDFEK